MYVHVIIVCSLIILYVGAAFISNAQFGTGVGLIALSDVRCNGTEERLLDCPAGNTITCTTSHREDSGVRCQPRTGKCCV